MYPVSNDYLAAIKAPAVKSRITGTVGAVSFTEDNILQGSFSITNQNSGDEAVQIGTVYIGELDITLFGLTLSRYSLNGVAITPNFGLLLPNDSYEDVPLGVYYIGEANYTRDGLQIRAYDAVSKLDKPCRLSTTLGTPYELASLMALNCGITLANTEQEFAAFANGDQTLSLYTDGSDIETWRDFASWLAQACGCYVTANRAGEIEFRQYGQTVVDTLSTSNRFLDASYSDYETRYTGMYVTNMKDGTMTYYALQTDDGLTYDMGSNPFLQYGTSEVKEAQRRAVLTALSVIDYVPFTIETVSNPMYDLGDVISLPGGRGDASKLFCVNKYTWTFHGGTELVGVGDNPALINARSKVDKDITGLQNSVSDVELRYLIYENATALSIADQARVNVLRLWVEMDRASYLSIDMEFLLTVAATGLGSSSASVDPVTGEVTVTATIPTTEIDTEYYFDGTQIIGHNPELTCIDGKHVLRIRWDALNAETGMHLFEVYFTADGGSVNIPVSGLIAWVSGTGLGGAAQWDGLITISDAIPPLDFSLAAFTDSAPAVTLQTPVSKTFGDTFNMLTMTLVTLADESEVMQGRYVNANTTAYIFDRTVPLDGIGWKATADGQYVDLVAVTGMTRFSSVTGKMLAYMASFDGGTTWQGWNGSAWVTDLQMSYDTIHAITTWTGSVMIRAIFDYNETCYGFMLEGVDA